MPLNIVKHDLSHALLCFAINMCHADHFDIHCVAIRSVFTTCILWYCVKLVNQPELLGTSVCSLRSRLTVTTYLIGGVTGGFAGGEAGLQQFLEDGEVKFRDPNETGIPASSTVSNQVHHCMYCSFDNCSVSHYSLSICVLV